MPEVLKSTWEAGKGIDDALAAGATVHEVPTAKNGTRAPARQAPVTETASELLASHIPPLLWIVYAMFAAGLAILVGRPKQGKSWLALGLALCVADGVPFLGRRTESGEVLYLALEDGRLRMQGRIQKLLGGRPAPPRLHIAYQWPRWNEGGGAELEEWLKQHPNAVMVVVDTWGRVAPPPSSRGDNYSDVTLVLGALQKIALERTVTVILVHHARKTPMGGESDITDGVLGTTAISGTADTICLLRRERGADAARFAITGRDVQDDEVTLGWTDTGWALQSAADTMRHDPVAKALHALACQGEWNGSPTELYDHLSEPETRRALQLEVEAIHARGWPATPARFGERLRQVEDVLLEAGVAVERERRGHGGRKVLTVSLVKQGDGAVGDHGDGEIHRRRSESASLQGLLEIGVGGVGGVGDIAGETVDGSSDLPSPPSAPSPEGVNPHGYGVSGGAGDKGCTVTTVTRDAEWEEGTL